MHIQNFMMNVMGLRVCFIVGDQQSFIRMVHLIRRDASRWGWIVPLPGDFHFEIHWLMAIHRITRACISRACARQLRVEVTGPN